MPSGVADMATDGSERSSDNMKTSTVLRHFLPFLLVGGCLDTAAEPPDTSSTGSTSEGSTTNPAPEESSSSVGGSSSSSGDPGTTSIETTGSPDRCIDDPMRGLEGTASPIEGFEFRNAFDPADRTIYDPEDAAALPGPLMVDTWGNRNRGAHGTLGVFPPGFSAPVHAHSQAYDGIVLRGEMTNPFGTDLEPFLDRDETNDHGDVVLGAGSYWHVPAGSHHTTTCLGPDVCWFYFHGEDAFDFVPLQGKDGMLIEPLEAPDSEAVLLPAAQLEFQGEEGSFVEYAPAWGSQFEGAHGTFGRFIPGGESPVHVHSQAYSGIVVDGTITNPFNLEDAPPALERGGYWDVPADAVHVTACGDDTECTFYFHSRGAFDFTPVCER